MKIMELSISLEYYLGNEGSSGSAVGQGNVISTSSTTLEHIAGEESGEDTGDGVGDWQDGALGNLWQIFSKDLPLSCLGDPKVLTEAITTIMATAAIKRGIGTTPLLSIF